MCTHQVFLKYPQLKCPNCNENLSKKKFNQHRLATQQFNKEADKRAYVHKMYVSYLLLSFLI